MENQNIFEAIIKETTIYHNDHGLWDMSINMELGEKQENTRVSYFIHSGKGRDVFETLDVYIGALKKVGLNGSEVVKKKYHFLIQDYLKVYDKIPESSSDELMKKGSKIYKMSESVTKKLYGKKVNVQLKKFPLSCGDSNLVTQYNFILLSVINAV